jgi:hypothetical protein
MSDRAREFLERWYSAHVDAMSHIHRVAEAVRLATKCRQDATSAGIDLQEIRAAAGAI